MAEEETKPAEESKTEETEKKPVNVLFVIAVVLIVGFSLVAILSSFNKPGYAIQETVAGVKVYSQIPLADFARYRTVALPNTNNKSKGGITCNFELAGISNNRPSGYPIFVEDGDMGVYLQTDRAYIRGKTEEEVVKACNVFACLQQGIDCSPHMWDMRNIIVQEKRINLILDENLSGSALRGYADLMGVLGYMQSEHAFVDLNGDGRVDKDEVAKNLITIFQYTKEGNVCTVQSTVTQLQALNATNETYACDELWPAITLTKSDEDKITVEGSRLTLSGDDEAVGNGAIIVRDALSTSWIRVYYRMD